MQSSGAKTNDDFAAKCHGCPYFENTVDRNSSLVTFSLFGSFTIVSDASHNRVEEYGAYWLCELSTSPKTELFS